MTFQVRKTCKPVLNCLTLLTSLACYFCEHEQAAVTRGRAYCRRNLGTKRRCIVGARRHLGTRAKTKQSFELNFLYLLFFLNDSQTLASVRATRKAYKMDFQNRAGGKTGSGGVASASESNRDRRERLRQLALETIDLNKVSYMTRYGAHANKYTYVVM